MGAARTLGATPARVAVEDALHGKRLDLGGILLHGMLLGSLLLTLTVLAMLLLEVVTSAWSVFAERGLGVVTSDLSSIASRVGVWQGIQGSLWLMAFVVLFSFPLGIGAAIYIEEYARDTRLTRFINANIRNLAGVPSVVYGLLGLAIFVRVLGGLTGGRSLISGGMTLAILVLPIVIITASEALRAVPGEIREAAYGVGATRWETIRSHVLPYAAPGVFTGTILALARAFGETAPLLMVGVATGFLSLGGGGLVDQLQGPYTALPAIIFRWSKLPQADFREGLAAAAIVVLLVVLLAVNALAIILRNRYERRW
ncbi:MAG TPA: phosphate ABC transporter permease PstA [Actinomycetota bacterium]